MRCKPNVAVLVMVLLLALAGCDQKISGSVPASSDDPSQQALMGAPAGNVVAMVNGEVVTEPLLDVFARGKGLDISNGAQRQRAMTDLEDTLLLAQEAIRSGVAAKPEVQAEVTLARLLQLSGRMVSTYRENTEVPEADVIAYYRQEVERAGSQEFHLQHILFNSEDAAIEAAGKGIRPDADFDALMGEYLAKGAPQARDLGWVNRTQVPAAIAESANNLNDGQVSPIPIHSEFGWHVLKRIAARPFTPPAFDSVKEGAERQLKARALSDQVKALRARATIQAPGSTPSPGAEKAASDSATLGG